MNQSSLERTRELKDTLESIIQKEVVVLPTCRQSHVYYGHGMVTVMVMVMVMVNLTRTLV